MNILGLLFAVAVVFILLVVSEFYWRKNIVHDEISRKFVHIMVGSFVATWPFFMGWGQIQILSIAFVITVALSKYLNLFQAIHSVQRPTGGELFFAAAVGLTTLITQDKYIFAAAILHMSLADGLAAIIGTRYGHHNQYEVLRQTKSLIGTATFILVSVVILGVYGLMAAVTLSPFVILAIAYSSAAIENIGLYGSDNLLVPLLVAGVLSVL
jgi:phytol kinase